MSNINLFSNQKFFGKLFLSQKPIFKHEIDTISQVHPGFIPCEILNFINRWF